MNHLVNWTSSWTNQGSLAILLFFPIVGLLLFSSLKIVKYSEMLITKSSLSGGFVGGALIAVVTSMPELITEVTQASAGTPANGLSDDLGSNLFSVLLIAIACFISWKYLFLNKVGKGTKIAIILSFFTTALLITFLAINKDVNLGTIGIMPMIIFFIYLFSLYIFYKYGDEDNNEDKKSFSTNNLSLKKIVARFSLYAVLTILFSIAVNVVVSSFQKGTGINSESAGGIMLAITTSLPEIVAFFGFLKLKQLSAAMASLVGSHFFNLGITFIGDLTYTSGPTFSLESMHEQISLAILLGSSLLILSAHLLLSWKYKKLFAKKYIYFISPSLIIAGYFIGWIIIMIYN